MSEMQRHVPQNVPDSVDSFSKELFTGTMDAFICGVTGHLTNRQRSPLIVMRKARLYGVSLDLGFHFHHIFLAIQ
jgi:hypothetical protein